MLTVENITVYHGSLPALRDVSFSVDAGEIVSLIGANGAGKSTVLKTLAGVLSPRSGRIALRGRRISGLPPHRIARMGVSLVPEGRGIFANMTVRENLEMGAYPHPAGPEADEAMARALKLFPRLLERISQPAGTLSGGEQQMLAIGRALAARPALLLLDEPSMGLSPLLVGEIFRMIREINRAGTTILLVEQNAYMALSVATRAYVLENGSITLSGEASSLRADPKVRAAYLGDDTDAVTADGRDDRRERPS
ncbi:MAG: ABC transporter ATP-binding protein [Gemmatimonadota bacterium]